MEQLFSNFSRYDEVKVALDQCYVDTPGHVRAMKGLQAALHTHLTTNNHVGVVLTGDAGVGKTRLLTQFDQWITRYRDQLDPERKPMLRVESPKAITIRTFNSSLLKAFGDPFWEKGKESEMRKRVENFYKETRPFGMAIDEFHNFSNSKADEPHRQTLGSLKQLMNELKPFVILSGTEEIRGWIRAHDELRGRFLRTVHIPRMELSSKETLRTFRSVLGHFAKIMPYAKDASPQDDINALRMFLATLGVFRNAIELNKTACDEAAFDGSDVVTRDHFAAAFEGIAADPEVKSNPFRLNKAAVLREAAPYSGQ